MVIGADFSEHTGEVNCVDEKVLGNDNFARNAEGHRLSVIFQRNGNDFEYLNMYFKKSKRRNIG